MTTETIKSELKKRKVESYEIFLQKTKINELQIMNDRINTVNKIVDGGYGVRIHNGGIGFSSSNLDTSQGIKRTVDNALRSAKISKKTNFGFPKPDKKYAPVENTDNTIVKQGFKKLESYAEGVISIVPKGVRISFGKLRTYDIKIGLVNSEGVSKTKNETYFMAEMSLMVESGGKKVEFWPHEYRRRIEDLPTSEIEFWAQLAKDQVKAKQPKTGKMPVIFSPRCVCDGLGGVIGYHSTGAAKVNEVSKFSADEKVASENLSILSDSFYPFGLMTNSFDDEGVATRKIFLIDGGFFKSHIYNQFYGFKAKVESTGNGFRQSDTFYFLDNKYGVRPLNQVSNFYVKPGNHSLGEMMSEIGNGIIVEKFSWLYPDATTGKFSSEIRAGYLIEDGEMTQPIKGGLVTGDMFEMIKNINTISNESIVCSGGTILAGVCPYISFDNVQVVGK